MSTNTARKYDFDDDEQFENQPVSEVKSLSSHQATYEFLSSLKKLKVFLISLSWVTFILCSALFLFGCSSGGGSDVPQSFQSELDIARGDLRALGMPTEAMGRVDPQVLWDLNIRPERDLLSLASGILQLDFMNSSRYRTGVGRLTEMERNFELFFYGLQGGTNTRHGIDFFRPSFLGKSGTLENLYDGKDTRWIDPFYFVDKLFANENCSIEKNEKVRQASEDDDLIPKLFSIDLVSKCYKAISPYQTILENASQGIPEFKIADRLDEFEKGWHETIEAKVGVEDLSEEDAFGAYRVAASDYRDLQAIVKDYIFYSDEYRENPQILGRGDFSEKSLQDYSYEVEKLEVGVYRLAASKAKREREVFESEDQYFYIRDFAYEMQVRFPLQQGMSDDEFSRLVECINSWDLETAIKASRFYSNNFYGYASDDEEIEAEKKISEIAQCGDQLKEALSKVVIETAAGFFRYYDKIKDKAFSLRIDAENIESASSSDDKGLNEACGGNLRITDGEGNMLTRFFSRKKGLYCEASDLLFNGKKFEINYDNY